MSAVLPSWRSSPFTQHWMASDCGSAISSAGADPTPPGEKGSARFALPAQVSHQQLSAAAVVDQHVGQLAALDAAEDGAAADQVAGQLHGPPSYRKLCC